MTDTTGIATTEGRIGHWMQTFTGRRFWPLDPRAKDVCIEDIAHALSLVNRFGGHSREAYSVAQHSVHVATLVERTHPKLALHALLHDASEAYLGDIVRPIKASLVFEAHGTDATYYETFSAIEWEVQHAIHCAFCWPDQLSYDDRQIIKHADNVALATEARDLMGDPRWPGLPEPDAEKLCPVSAWTAERAFLAMFRRLRGTKA
jgi:uncharacterized protein